ncbi:MAG: hypothetical protein ACYDEI_00055 [Erysipelotrichaceae bacterium]
MEESTKSKLWKRVYSMLTDRKKEFIDSYLKNNRKVPVVSKELNMNIQSAYKYLRTDKMIKLALDINDIGADSFEQIEMPTYEWILFELMKAHNLDQKELDSKSGDYLAENIQRCDKLKDRMEKRFKQISELKNKTNEVLDDENFKLRSLGKDQLIELGKSLYKEIDDFVQKKAWYEEQERKNEKRAS